MPSTTVNITGSSNVVHIDDNSDGESSDEEELIVVNAHLAVLDTSVNLLVAENQHSAITVNATFQVHNETMTPIPNTQFNCCIDIIKDNDQITINFPAINFQAGLKVPDQYYYISPPINYVRSVAGFIPKEFCPNALTYASITAPGQTVKSFSNKPALFLGSISGDILTVTSAAMGRNLTPGMVLSASGVTAGTVILAYGNGVSASNAGKGGLGTYIVSKSQTVAANTQIEVIKRNDFGTVNYLGLGAPSVPLGYQLSIGVDGDVFIGGGGGKISFVGDATTSLGPGLLPGPVSIAACSITYKNVEIPVLDNNTRLNLPVSNATQNSDSYKNSAYRDQFLPAANNNKGYWTWADNSFDISNNVNNCMYVKGSTVGGTITGLSSAGAGTTYPNSHMLVADCIPNCLTNNALLYSDNSYSNYYSSLIAQKTLPITRAKYPRITTFGTNTCINAVDPSNVIVSWFLGSDFSNNIAVRACCRAVSYDGGLTFPINGPLNITSQYQPLGDNKGAYSDKYGNIWYTTTFLYHFSDSASTFNLAVSPDNGVTFYLAYVGPWTQASNGYGSFDTPQISFGYDISGGQYGIWYTESLFGNEAFPTVGFFPITGKMSDASCATFNGYIGTDASGGTANTTLTVTSMITGTLRVGQKLCANNVEAGTRVDPTTTIIRQIDISGGDASGNRGTYEVSIQQYAALGTSLSKMYTSFPPIGSLPVVPNLSVRTVTDVSVNIIPVASSGDRRTITVNSTAGCPQRGIIIIRGITFYYNTTDATHFRSCIAGTGVNDSAGVTLYSGDVVTIPSTLSFLSGLENSQTVSCNCSAEDGRVWIFEITDNGSVYYKSAPPSLATTNIVADNWAGPFPVCDTFSSNQRTSGHLVASPVYGFFGNSGTILFDEVRQALYVVVVTYPVTNVGFDSNPIAPDSQNMSIYLLISVTNGLSWSAPIMISNTSAGNRGQQAAVIDPVTNDLVFSWYDGRSGAPGGSEYATTPYQTVQFYGSVLAAADLDAYVADLTPSNPIFLTGTAHIPADQKYKFPIV